MTRRWSPLAGVLMFYGLGTAIALGPALGPAFGQAAATHVEDVVVTAPGQSLSEEQATALQSVPQAATVITQDQIEAQQITNLQQAKSLVPGVNMKVLNIQNNAFNIRGFGNATGTSISASPSGVPIYIDGIYYPRPGTSLMDIPDLTGFQVLKGPQGTSGGYDSTSGAVYVSTALPSFTAGQKLSIGYGSYNYANVNYSATGPIADSNWAAFRLSLFGDYNDGWLYSIYNSNPQRYFGKFGKGVRAQVLLQPTNDLSIRLVADYSFLRYTCCISLTSGVITNYANGQPVANNFFQRAARVGYTPQSFNGLQRWNTDVSGTYGIGPGETASSGGGAVIVNYNLNGYALNSTTAIRQYTYQCHWWNNTIINVDTARAGCWDPTSWSAQEDLSIATPKGGPVDVKAGVFVFLELFRSWNQSWNGSQAAEWFSPTSNPEVNNVALNWAKQNSYDMVSTRNVSPYAQAIWHATEELEMTFGLRFTESWKSGFASGTLTGQSGEGLSAADQALAQQVRSSVFGAPASWSQYISSTQGLLTGLVSASYKFTPDAMGYATYAHGGRLGGPNVSYGYLPQGAQSVIKNEETDSYEIGLKTSFLDNRVQANVAAFLIEDRNYITPVAQILDVGTTISYVANAPRARSRGFEVDVRARPIDELNVYFNGSYNDARYTSFPSAPCPFEYSFQSSCNLTGKPLSFTPRWAFSVGAEYDLDLGIALPSLYANAVTFFVGPDFSWQSATYSGDFGENANSAYSVISGYGILNLHGGLKANDGSWNLTGWAHNALDHRYFLYKSANYVGSGLVGGVPGQPLMAGATFTLKF